MSKNKNVDLHKQSSKGKPAEVQAQTGQADRADRQNKPTQA